MGDYPILSGETIDEEVLGDWLEDDGQWSRYATDPEDSVWVCNECEHLEDNCECVGLDGLPLMRI